MTKKPIKTEKKLAEEKYKALRSLAMSAVEDEINQLLTHVTVRLTHITSEALDLAVAWRKAYYDKRENHEPGWNWTAELNRFRSRPRRIELAIWGNDVLCGLALGRISDKKIVVTIHLIESNPTNNPLKAKIVPIAAQFIEVLGNTLGVREISIERPVNSLIDFYVNQGFKEKEMRKNKIIRLKKVL